MKPLFNIVVWGDHYIDLMMDVAIPSLLSPNNLPVYRKSDSVFVIYTFTEFRDKIKSHPTFKALSKLMRVDVIHQERPEGVLHNYHILTGCHLHALSEAYKLNRPVVFLSPDTCWSDGSILTVKKALEAGKRAVMVAGLRIEYESVMEEIDDVFPLQQGQVRVTPARDLVKFSLPKMHLYTKSQFWDCPHFNKSVAHYLFEVPGEGILSRFFVMHPLMAWPRKRVKEMTYTIDIDLIPAALDDYDDLEIITDSDDLYVIEISRKNDPDPKPYIKQNGSLIMWSKHQDPEFPDDLDMKALAASVHCKHHFDNPFARRYMHENIRYHYGQRSARWECMERRADNITYMVETWMDQEPVSQFVKFLGPTIEGEILAGAGPRW